MAGWWHSVRLPHGEADQNAPVAASIPGEGHFSTVAHHLEEGIGVGGEWV